MYLNHKIFGFVSFDKPCFTTIEISKNGFYINKGLNNFRLNSKIGDIPTVTYLFNDKSPYMLQVVNN